MTNHTEQQQTFDVLVVGGGIAGLVVGLSAAERGVRVAVVDSTTPGGRAKTAVRDGYLYNVGPHALYLAGHLMPFLEARGLRPAGSVPANKTIDVVRDGELRSITFSASGLARTKLLAAKSRLRVLTLLATLPRMKTDQFVGTTWQDWLGNEPDDVAGLLRMLGRVATYVNAPATFDAAAALNQIKAALRGVLYVDGGWQSIVDSLASAFERAGGAILAGRTVLSVGHGDDEGLVVDTSQGAIRARAVVIAGLSPAAAAAITGTSVAGSGALGGVAQAAVLDLALDRVHHGVVFGIDEPLYLSPHAPVAKLAPAGCGLVQLLRYVPDGDASTDPGHDRARLSQLAEQAGIARDAIVHERYLHRLVVANGFPTAAGGGMAGRPDANALGVEGVFVAGDWVGPRHLLADASSASAEHAAGLAVEHARRQVRSGV